MQGTAPDGAPVAAGLFGEWSGRLLFLTSSCIGCRAVWEALGAGEDAARGGSDAPVVVITPSPSTESGRAVLALAPAGVRVVMSSEGWHAYGVTAAPWMVDVAGGVVVAEGPAGG